MKQLQPARTRSDFLDKIHPDSIVIEANEITTKHGISFNEALKVLEIIEYRRHAMIMIEDGEYFDKNMAGVNSKLKSLGSSINQLIGYTASITACIKSIDEKGINTFEQNN
jgi:hypothetical protein